jgi:hypothetical protein
VQQKDVPSVVLLPPPPLLLLLAVLLLLLLAMAAVTAKGVSVVAAIQACTDCQAQLGRVDLRPVKLCSPQQQQQQQQHLHRLLVGTAQVLPHTLLLLLPAVPQLAYSAN